MKTIVTLVDFSDVTSKLISESGKFAKAFESRVILVHVVPMVPVVMDIGIGSPIVSEPPNQKALQADRERVASLGTPLREAGIEVLVEQLQERSATDLIGECSQWKADLIIVGSHHHGEIYNLFVGSFTSDVLKSANCPVLVVPADK